MASEASGGGGAAGRPRIVAEGDVLRVSDNYYNRVPILNIDNAEFPPISANNSNDL